MPRSIFARIKNNTKWKRFSGDSQYITVDGFPSGTAIQIDLCDGILRDFTTTGSPPPENIITPAPGGLNISNPGSFPEYNFITTSSGFTIEGL